jgi:hypothetical protein
LSELLAAIASKGEAYAVAASARERNLSDILELFGVRRTDSLRVASVWYCNYDVKSRRMTDEYSLITRV